MLDRLVRVGAECAGWLAELPVEMDGGGEGEDACGDPADQAGWAAREVLFESQLVLEALHDRFDPLPDRAGWWARPLWLVAAAGAEQVGAERGDRLLEVDAGEALVGDHELAADRLTFEQRE